VDHTSELEVEIEAPTEDAVFQEALAALAELLWSVSAEGDDRPALLAAWMEELVFLAEAEGFEPLAMQALELGPHSAQATVTGRLGQPPPLVKAVTYHRLSFARAGHGYRATVVLDV
jgi:SHS2 domain-containing protein